MDALAPPPGAAGLINHGECLGGIPMRGLRFLVAGLLLLWLATPAFALVPRAVFAELGAATW